MKKFFASILFAFSMITASANDVVNTVDCVQDPVSFSFIKKLFFGDSYTEVVGSSSVVSISDDNKATHFTHSKIRVGVYTCTVNTSGEAVVFETKPVTESYEEKIQLLAINAKEKVVTIYEFGKEKFNHDIKPQIQQGTTKVKEFFANL